MSERPVKPKQYFAKLLAISEDKIDYTDSPSTTRGDREGAEVLFPVTPEEFRAIEEFIRARRGKAGMPTKNVDLEKIKKIAQLGKKFPRIYLFHLQTEDDSMVDIGHKQQYARKKLEIKEEWYVALQFFLSKVFYGGLRDEQRLKYYWNTRVVLDNYGSVLLDRELPNDLDFRLRSGRVDNPKDRKMVIDSVKTARRLHNSGTNFVLHTINLACTGKIRKMYTKLGDIYGIGPKRASVFLRDVVMIWALEANLSDEDLICCVPIDTHVQQTCELIGLAAEPPRRDDAAGKPCVDRRKLADVDSKALAKLIIGACNQEGVSPFFFNTGAWMLGMARKRIKRKGGIPVEQILRKLEAGNTEEEVIAADYSKKLTRDDIRAAQITKYFADEELLYR